MKKPPRVTGRTSNAMPAPLLICCDPPSQPPPKHTQVHFGLKLSAPVDSVDSLSARNTGINGSPATILRALIQVRDCLHPLTVRA